MRETKPMNGPMNARMGDQPMDCHGYIAPPRLTASAEQVAANVQMIHDTLDRVEELLFGPQLKPPAGVPGASPRASGSLDSTLSYVAEMSAAAAKRLEHILNRS